MSLAQVDSTAIGNTQNTTRPAPKDETAIRRMAMEFEAVLLNQLTASLNPVDENEEDGLFSNSGGLALSRQMFSEQMAKTMSQSGGIGLADLILSQVSQKSGPVKPRDSMRAMEAAREIRAESGTNATTTKAAGQSKSSGKQQPPNGIAVSEAPATSSASASPATTASSKSVAARGAENTQSATRPRRVHSVKPAVATPINPAAVNERRAIHPTAQSPRRSAVPVFLNSPIRGEIRSVFGPRRDPINGRQRFHQGIDIAAKRGTPIGAAAAGTVVFAGRNKGYGNMVMIEHADGRRTLYAHAERLFVKAGETVAAGQTVAAVGSTGHSTGPHLHFEVREGKQALNPLTVLANGLTLARR